MIVFLGGRKDRREFQGLARDIREIAARFGAALVERDGFAADRTLSCVDFFILLRSCPNEFSFKEVEALRRVSPLAPIATIAGKLCESEDRTGERFPGVRRFYPSGWRETGRAEFIRFFDVHGATGLFTAPSTASEIELRAGRAYAARIERLDEERTLILSDDATSARFLADACHKHGAAVRVESLAGFVPEASSFEPTRVVIDADAFIDGRLVERIRCARERYPLAAFELLTFSPTESETEYFEDPQRWGRMRVVAKPFDVASLLKAG